MSRMLKSFFHLAVIVWLTTSPAFAQKTDESTRLKKFLPNPSAASTAQDQQRTKSDRTPETPDASLLASWAQCIPGTIEAESYYEMSGIQTEACQEGTLNVAYIDAGDWFKFKVNVLQTGTYLVEYRVASGADGGEIILDQDATPVAVPVAVPPTGGWQHWTTVSQFVNLQKGIQNLAIYASQSYGGFNVNWIRFSKFGQTIPGTIEAAEYSNMSGIVTEDSQDGGGLSIGQFTTNDWVEYPVYAEQTASYFVEFRVAADVGFGGEFAVAVDGNTVETLIVKPTPGWYNWKNVGAFIDLPQGQHTLRITALTSYNGPANDTINLHWMKFSKRKFAWREEFNYTGKPKPYLWNYDIQPPGWVNNELQWYTNSLDNAHVENGALTIEARNDYLGNQYSSGRIKSIGSSLYGRAEVRAKVAGGTGSWPAIWMLPKGEFAYGNGWPDSGEIDIMEYVGFDPGVIHGSAHNHTYFAGTAQTASYGVADAETAFHTYAIEWFEDRVDYFVDDVKYFTIFNPYTGWETWPYDKPFYLILNVAVGGTWGGQQGVDQNAFPMKMVIDYVRVYKAGPTTTLPLQCLLQPAPAPTGIHEE